MAARVLCEDYLHRAAGLGKELRLDCGCQGHQTEDKSREWSGLMTPHLSLCANGASFITSPGCFQAAAEKNSSARSGSHLE